MEPSKATIRGQAGARIVYVTYLPATPKAIAIVVHGIGEHMGRYRHVAGALAGRDYAVYGSDHRGHGESGGARCNVERFGYFIDDLQQIVERATADLPGLPVYLVAHSMGGLIAVNYAIKHQEQLAGMILSAPGLGARGNLPPLLIKVAGVLARVAPGLPVTMLATGSESALSRDPQIQELFDADPLCYHGKVKARMGNELLKAVAAAWAGASTIRLPLLIMHGSADMIVPVANSERLYQEVASEDKLLRLWDGGRHETFNELYKDAAITEMLDWLDEHVAEARGEGQAAISSAVETRRRHDTAA